jgi:hypothetical protein
MNHVDSQLREAARANARATRVAMYEDWLAHDADGLAFNLTHPIGEQLPDATAILAEAREKVTLALGRIDQAIERDKQAHKE